MIVRIVRALASILLGAAIAFACFAPEPLLLKARAYLPAVKVRAARSCAEVKPVLTPAVIRVGEDVIVSGERRIMRLGIVGYVVSATRETLASALAAAEAAGITDVEMLIDSKGGESDAGIAMAMDLAGSKPRIHCLVGSSAMSAAFTMLQGCDDRAALPASALMQHYTFAYTAERTAYSAEMLKELTDSLFRSRAFLVEMLSLRSAAALHDKGLTEEEVAQRLSQGDWRMSPTEAVAFGFIDRVVSDAETFQASIER